MSADYYELLGVSRTASAEELKRAYRQRARELHPDANPDDPAAAERFKEVARAYEVLSDPEQRGRYDRYGEAGVGAGAGGNAGDPFGFGASGLGDIFEAFFNAGQFRGRSGPAGPPRGQDLEVVAELDFADAVFGTTAPVTVRTAVTCEQCSGSGAGEGTKPVTCADCNGTGEVRRVRQSILGQMVTAGPCTRCGGLGQVVVTPCPVCRGEGRRIEDRTYHVDVPPGVDSGSTLRLTKRGAVGPRGGPPGDLYVHLSVRPHERFRRDGDDLVDELHVAMTQAALGVELAYETLDGEETVVITPGTPSGKEIRLRGRGVPHVGGRGRGDLRIRVAVDTPAKLTKSQEELLRRLAEERGEEVAPPQSGLFARLKSAFGS